MAYGISIPGRSVASNYAASFRPVGVAPGFSQVKSDLAANYLMQVPMLRQELEMSLAKQALAEAGATERLDRKLDADMKIAEKSDKVNKLLTIAGMSGGEGGSSSLLSPLNQQLQFENVQGSLEAIDDARKVLASQRINQRMNQYQEDPFKVLGQNVNTNLQLESILPKADAAAIQSDADFMEYITGAMKGALESQVK
jgi:hypothetical protein